MGKRVRNGSEQPRIRRSKTSKIVNCLQPLLEAEKMPSFVLRLTELNNFFSYFFLSEVPLLDEAEIRNREILAATL
jgi:hypothetical protein